jgi:hypothetical protein
MTTSPRFFAATRTVFAETRLVDVRACIIIFRKFRVRVYAVATRPTLGMGGLPGAGHPIPRFALRDPSILSRSARPTDRPIANLGIGTIAICVCVNSARGSTYVHPRSPPSRGPNLATWNLDLGARSMEITRGRARDVGVFARSISIDRWIDERASIRTESFGASVDDGRTDGRTDGAGVGVRRSSRVWGHRVCVRVERRADEGRRTDGRTRVSFRFVSFRASKVR